MLESTKINRRTNVSGGERVFRCPPHRLQPGFRFDDWPARARFPKRSPDPFAHCHVFSFGQTLYVRHFPIRMQDLEALTHGVSGAYS